MPSPLGFIDSLDIANRACQHMGVARILRVDEESKQNEEITFAYDKLRQAELRRNVWTFSTRRVILRPIDTTTMLLKPKAWDATVTYAEGSLVVDDNGVIWSSTQPENLNNDPVTTTAWEQYFGPLTVVPYDEEQEYFPGELVYVAVGMGGFAVFKSLTDNTGVDPATATAWDDEVTYNKGEVVTSGGSQWRSLIELNLNITPADAPNDFDVDATYSSGQTTVGSDGYIYTSAINNNTGNDPVTDGGSNWTNSGTPRAWSRTPEIYASAQTWLPLYAGLQNIAFQYPIGASPASNQRGKNVFRLPAGYLRVAPQAPKAGSNSILGASTGLLYNDWEFEANYLVSCEPDFIMFRFVADLKDVSAMDPMFCEGLAARIAYECCEPVTQSTSRKSIIAGDYTKFMGDARVQNAIEAGSEEPPVDDWEACRY